MTSGFEQVRTSIPKMGSNMTTFRSGFQEGVDLIVKIDDNPSKLGGRPITNHIMTLDMAKEVAMIQHTERH